MTVFEVDDRVKHVSKGYYGHIKGLDPVTREAWVKEEKTGKNNQVGLSLLVHAPVPKEEAFRPGWYTLSGLRVENFIYYVTAYHEGVLRYCLSYNPKTGEMDNFAGGAVMLPSMVFRGSMTRMKFVAE